MSRDSKKIKTERHLRKILGLRDSAYIEMGDSEDTDKKPEMKIFFVDLTNFTSTAQFLILCSATFFFYLIYGYFQV